MNPSLRSTLTETRAEDRLRMADEVARIARAHGHQADVQVAGIRGPRCAHVGIRTADGRLAVSVDFRGDSPQMEPNTFVLPWHLTLDCPRDVFLQPAKFDNAVNPHHGAKATLVRHGFVELCQHLHGVLAAAADGSAYSSELPPLSRRRFSDNTSFIIR